MISAFGACIFCLGVVFKVIAVIGVLRLPDFCSKVHAAGIVDSAGMVLVLIGLAIQHGFSIFSLKVFVLIVLLLISNTTMCNVLTRAACGGKGESKGVDNQE